MQEAGGAGGDLDKVTAMTASASLFMKNKSAETHSPDYFIHIARFVPLRLSFEGKEEEEEQGPGKGKCEEEGARGCGRSRER